MTLRIVTRRWAWVLVILTLLASLRLPAAGAESIAVGAPDANSALATAMAERLGYLREEGMTLQTVLLRGEILAKALAAGSVAFSTDVGQAVGNVISGLPIKVVLISTDKPSFDFYAHPQVKSIKDLRGKIAAVSSFGSLSDRTTRKMIETAGLRPGMDVTIVVIGTGSLRFAALRAGSVQVALLTVPFNFQAQDEGFSRLGFGGDFLRAIGSGVSIADRMVQANPEQIQRFVRATLKGHLTLRENRQRILPIVRAYLQIKDDQQAARIYDYRRPTFTANGWVDEAVMREVIQEAKVSLKSSREVRSDEVFTPIFVQRALKELAASGFTP